MPESDDLRQFLRDIARRHERIWREQAAALREQSVMLNETLAGLRETQRGLREVREDSRAHTQALLRVLDRLENGGAQA